MLYAAFHAERFVQAPRDVLAPIRKLINAARANGLAVIDGVYNDIANTDGFKAACEQGRAFGFDGKTLIHPTQVEPCNAVFAPSAAEVEDARKLIAAFELPENKGKGVVQVDGRMVEIMHAEMARRTVAIADAIEAKTDLNA